MHHLLCRGQALGEDPSLGAVYAGLYSSADPRRGVVPGETLQLGLSVAADGGAPRGCGYLLEAPLAEAGEILAVQGLEYFPRQRWFRVRAEAGATATGMLQLRVDPKSTERRIRPRIVVGIPDASGRKLVRTAELGDEALTLRPPAARGLHMAAEPGRTASVNLLSAAPAGSTAVSVTQPRSGTAELAYDGWVTYTPSPGFQGYDRFTYVVAGPDGAELGSHVNVLVGGFPETPGVFPQQPVDAAFRPWQWPELTGEMPWPRPGGSARNR